MKKKNFKLYRGDDFFFEFAIVKEGVGYLLEDSQLYLTAKLSTDQPKPLFQLSFGNGINLINGNTIQINFSHDLTKNFEWKSAMYDLQLISANGLRETLMRGRIKLIHDVGRI